MKAQTYHSRFGISQCEFSQWIRQWVRLRQHG